MRGQFVVPSVITSSRAFDDSYAVCSSVIGAFDVPYGVPSVQGKPCAYCGRYAVEPHGSCEGCGAPLNRREVKPL